MNEMMDVKKAERKVYTLNFEDGLWDMVIALVVLELSLRPLLIKHLGDFWSAIIFVPLWVLAVIVVLLIKSWVVMPRVGKVSLHNSQRAPMARLNFAMLICLSLLLITGALALTELNVSENIMVIFLSLFSLIVFSVAGRLLKQPRYIIYGAIVALAPIIGVWLSKTMGISHNGFPLTLGIASGVILITGIGKFIRFLKKYSLVFEERK